MTMLTYDIFNEMLEGDVGGQRFSLHAVSGGGRGSTLKPQGDDLSRSWCPYVKEDEDKQIRGGVIPPGFYICRYVANHPVFHQCICLDQTATSLIVPDPSSAAGVSAIKRSGFYIHSSGPKGSDGCIVIPDNSERHRLNLAIRDNDGTPLRVVHPYLPDGIAPMDGTAFA